MLTQTSDSVFFNNSSSLFELTVPSSVSGVTVNNSGRNDYLSVSWLPAPGDVDNYVVTLSHDGKVVQSLMIAKSVIECSFSSLTPGRLYNVTITTRSGNYASHSFGEERTGKDYEGTRCYRDRPAVWLLASWTCSDPRQKAVCIAKLVWSLSILTEKNSIGEQMLHLQEDCPSFHS